MLNVTNYAVASYSPKFTTNERCKVNFRANLKPETAKKIIKNETPKVYALKKYFEDFWCNLWSKNYGSSTTTRNIPSKA